MKIKVGSLEETDCFGEMASIIEWNPHTYAHKSISYDNGTLVKQNICYDELSNFTDDIMAMINEEFYELGYME